MAASNHHAGCGVQRRFWRFAGCLGLLESVFIQHVEMLLIGVKLAVLLAGDFADNGVSFQSREGLGGGGSGNCERPGCFGDADDRLALQVLVETDDGGGFGTEDFAIALEDLQQAAGGLDGGG